MCIPCCKCSCISSTPSLPLDSPNYPLSPQTGREESFKSTISFSTLSAETPSFIERLFSCCRFKKQIEPKSPPNERRYV